MKLLDNYLDKYYMRKVSKEILDSLLDFNIDKKAITTRRWDGYLVDISVKLREENEMQYVCIYTVRARTALKMMCHIKKAIEAARRETKQVLIEKHERLGR